MPIVLELSVLPGLLVPPLAVWERLELLGHLGVVVEIRVGNVTLSSPLKR